MQKQARAAVEQKEREKSSQLEARVFEKKDVKINISEDVLEEEMEKEMKEKRAVENLEMKLEDEISVGLISEEEQAKVKLEQEKAAAEKAEKERIEAEKV